MEGPSYKNKVVLITASSTGIGLGMASYYCRLGAIVIISSRNQSNIDSAIKQLTNIGGQPVGFLCHVAKKQDRIKLYEFIKQKFGKIDVVCLNAAVSTHFGDLLEMKETAMDKMYEVNIKAQIMMSQELVKKELLSKDGNVLVISSITGYSPDNSLFFYSLTKTLLIQFTKAFQNYLINHDVYNRVRVNCIAPGIIKTNFSKMLWEDEKALTESMGVERVGNVDDIAKVAVFLTDNQKAEYIKGETITVAGKVIAKF